MADGTVHGGSPQPNPQRNKKLEILCCKANKDLCRIPGHDATQASAGFVRYKPAFAWAACPSILRRSKFVYYNMENISMSVSNLSFISKLVERVVCVQLVEHLKTNNLYEIFQSAYRQLPSTETALLRVQNDLLQAVDNRREGPF